MRVLVFVLVLCNLLFFAFKEGYFGFPENPDALRVHQQVSPERIKLVDQAAVETRLASPERQAAERSSPTGGEQAPPRCLVWNGLLQADSVALSSRLGKRFPALKFKQMEPVSNGTWWVFIPPLANRKAAEAALAALEKEGVSDILVMQEGPSRNAVSLGIFSTQEAATLRLKEVHSKGFDSARLAPRRKEAAYALEARGPEGDLAEARKLALGLISDIRPMACK